MTEEEATEFVKMVDGAWGTPLGDVQKELWYDLVRPLDAKTAFAVLVRSFRTEKYRPSAPDFHSLYRHELRDTTPVAHLTPEGYEEMPRWVKGWFIAAAEGDHRLWPEMEKGSREIHDWHRPGKGEISGYEWEANVQALGIMPQADRIAYMARADNGEGPRSAAEIAAALTGSPPE